METRTLKELRKAVKLVDENIERLNKEIDESTKRIKALDKEIEGMKLKNSIMDFQNEFLRGNKWKT